MLAGNLVDVSSQHFHRLQPQYEISAMEGTKKKERQQHPVFCSTKKVIVLRFGKILGYHNIKWSLRID